MIQVKDNANNIANYEYEININQIDKISPHKPIIEGTSSDWINTSAVLKVICNDSEADSQNSKSGIAYFEYSIDAGKTFTKVNWSDNPIFTVDNSGDYTNKILVKVTDNAGNISELSDFYTIKIDKFSPEIISVDVNTENWTNQDVTLTINAIDNDSNLHPEAYSFDGGKSWQLEPIYVCIQNKKIPSGTIQVRDSAKNISYYENDININKIDKLAPQTPEIEGSSHNWVNDNVTLKIICKDTYSNDDYGQSGIAYFEYSIDGAKTFKKVNWSGNPTFTITESGDYTDKIFVRTFDNAGNISNLSSPYTVKLNKKVNDIFDQTDEVTGIKAQAISGVIPKGTRLVIDKLDQTTLERAQEYKKIYGQIDENIKKTMERYKLFEIYLLDIQGNIIQPNGFVTISIPIPDYFDKTKDDIDVYRIQSGLDDDDDFDEHIKKIGETYYCVFDTNHFSPYALIDKNTNIPKYNNPNIIIILSFILFLISLIIFLIIFLLKRRKKQNN